jgi:hypothetical protein
LDDVAHRRVKTARCVQLDDERNVTTALGLLHRVGQMIGDDRGDRIIDPRDEHPDVDPGGLARGRDRQRQQRQETQDERNDRYGPRRRPSSMLQLWRTKKAVTL